MFTGRTDVEAETPIVWPPHEKNWLIWKDPHAGKDWWQEVKGMTEDEMVGWHHWVNGMSLGKLRELVMDREAWGHKESDMTEWTELMGSDAMILVFWMLCFKPAFSLSSFILIKRLFSSFSLSAIIVVSSAYLRLLIFLWQSWFQLVIHPVRHFTWCTLHIS